MQASLGAEMITKKKSEERSIWSLNSESLQQPRKRILLKVGGRLFETWADNLENHPETLLGSPEKELFYDSVSKTYVFDRDPQMFRQILNYYRYCVCKYFVKNMYSIEHRIKNTFV